MLLGATGSLPASGMMRSLKVHGLVGLLCDCRQTDSHGILEAHCFVVDNEQIDLEHTRMYVCSRFVLNLLPNFTSQN